MPNPRVITELTRDVVLGRGGQKAMQKAIDSADTRSLGIKILKDSGEEFVDASFFAISVAANMTPMRLNEYVVNKTHAASVT